MKLFIKNFMLTMRKDNLIQFMKLNHLIIPILILHRIKDKIQTIKLQLSNKERNNIFYLVILELESHHLYKLWHHILRKY